MRVNHIEMTLVDWNINRFANCSAGMMQTRGYIGELDEILKVFNGCIAAPLIQVKHEGTAVGRNKHGVLATNLHTTLGIARMLGVFSRG